MTWANAVPSAVKGMTTADAYGAALDYMAALVRQHQQRAISAWRQGHQFAKPPAQLATFTKDAAWRRHPMGIKQEALLTKLKVNTLSQTSQTSATLALGLIGAVDSTCSAHTPTTWSQHGIAEHPIQYQPVFWRICIVGSLNSSHLR